MNDYLLSITVLQKELMFVFPCNLEGTIDEIDHPWYLSSHGELLGVWRSNFATFRSMLRLLRRGHRGSITALKFVNLGIYILGFIDNTI